MLAESADRLLKRFVVLFYLVCLGPGALDCHGGAVEIGQIGLDIPPKGVGEGDEGEAILVPETGCGLNIGLRSVIEAEEKKEGGCLSGGKSKNGLPKFGAAREGAQGFLNLGPCLAQVQREQKAAVEAARFGAHFTQMYSVEILRIVNPGEKAAET